MADLFDNLAALKSKRKKSQDYYLAVGWDTAVWNEHAGTFNHEYIDAITSILENDHGKESYQLGIFWFLQGMKLVADESEEVGSESLDYANRWWKREPEQYLGDPCEICGKASELSITTVTMPFVPICTEMCAHSYVKKLTMSNRDIARLYMGTESFDGPAYPHIINLPQRYAKLSQVLLSKFTGEKVKCTA